jgi:dsRNA-specific ribonuclease
MENTIDQLIANNIDSNTDPRFAGFVSRALQELCRQQPDVEPETLIQDATDMAYEAWDSYIESLYYQEDY